MVRNMSKMRKRIVNIDATFPNKSNIGRQIETLRIQYWSGELIIYMRPDAIFVFEPQLELLRF